MLDKHIFEKSAGDKAFWLSNGQKVDTIKELYKILDSINDEVFSYHVNSDRNDFSTWVKGVFNEEELAEKISNLTSRKKIKSVIGDWIFEVVHKKIKAKAKTSQKVSDSAEVKTEKKNLINIKGVHNRGKILAGVVDFVLGFIVGILSMLLFMNMV